MGVSHDATMLVELDISPLSDEIFIMGGNRVGDEELALEFPSRSRRHAVSTVTEERIDEIGHDSDSAEHQNGPNTSAESGSYQSSIEPIFAANCLYH